MRVFTAVKSLIIANTKTSAAPLKTIKLKTQSTNDTTNAISSVIA